MITVLSERRNYEPTAYINLLMAKIDSMHRIGPSIGDIRSKIGQIDNDPLLRQITIRKNLLTMCAGVAIAEGGFRIIDLLAGTVPALGTLWDVYQALSRGEVDPKSRAKIIEFYNKRGIYLPEGVFSGGGSQLVDVSTEILGNIAAVLIPGDQTIGTIGLEVVNQLLNLARKMKFSGPFIVDAFAKYRRVGQLRNPEILLDKPQVSLVEKTKNVAKGIAGQAGRRAKHAQGGISSAAKRIRNSLTSNNPRQNNK